MLPPSRPWPALSPILDAFNQGMAPYLDPTGRSLIHPMPILPQQQEQPSGWGAALAGLAQGLGSMKRKPKQLGGGVPKQMDVDDPFPQ